MKKILLLHGAGITEKLDKVSAIEKNGYETEALTLPETVRTTAKALHMIIMSTMFVTESVPKKRRLLLLVIPVQAM